MWAWLAAVDIVPTGRPPGGGMNSGSDIAPMKALAVAWVVDIAPTKALVVAWVGGTAPRRPGGGMGGVQVDIAPMKAPVEEWVLVGPLPHEGPGHGGPMATGLMMSLM